MSNKQLPSKSARNQLVPVRCPVAEHFIFVAAGRQGGISILKQPLIFGGIFATI